MYQQAHIKGSRAGGTTGKSESESPQKKRLLDQMVVSVKSGMNLQALKRNKTERKKNALLMVDGRGVNQTEFIFPIKGPTVIHQKSGA